MQQAAGVGGRTVAATGVALCLAGASLVALQGPDIAAHWSYLAACAALFTGMLLLWASRPRDHALQWLLFLGILVRLCFLRFPLSDDVNRYLWEGLIQLHGFDPFVTPPDSPSLGFLRDALWEGINHRGFATVYWPLAQLLFRFAAFLNPSPWVWKPLALLMDSGVMLLVVLCLRSLNRPVHHALLYWLNPLVLVSTAGEGHVEVMGVLLLMLALWARLRNRHTLMYAALGLAVMVKVSLVIAVPLMIRRETLKYSWAMLLPFGLFLLYPHGAMHALEVPLRFAREFSHNGLAFSLLEPLCGAHTRTAAFSLLLTVLAFVFFLDPNPWHALRGALAAFVILSPTMHPWYLTLLTPLLCFAVSPAWLTLHLTVLPLAFFFSPQAAGTWWSDRVLLMSIEYTPFLLAAIVALAWRLRATPRRHGALPSVSVVIPTLNERDTIAGCIEAVRAQNVDAQVVVSDGGSTDGTLGVLAQLPDVLVAQAPRGRGRQIATGLTRCTGEVVVIVHADSRLVPGVLVRMQRWLAADPDAVGGACGARYDSPSLRFRLTELLNSARAVLFGVTFGDQAQFFRREHADTVPPYLLMEDVEISFRLQERGRCVFIPNGVQASTRRWTSHGYAVNFFRVLFLTGLYVVRRRCGLLSDDCSEFYRRYYDTPA